ncbi:MAG: T9SS type A sorting domain-containing protein [Bacteroidetes bacterium]|nr:T9SS type A sorting domain-containing protein [Bacteroidota bacterium]
MVVFIATDRPVSGTISVPLGGYNQSFTIAADSVFEIELPATTVMHVGSEIIESKGVHIITSDSVLVYILNTRSNSSDGTSILPIQNLGISYSVLNYYSRDLGIPGHSEFLIVAPFDSTSIVIESSDTTVSGNLPGMPISIVLNSGQSYQVQNGDGDLTGSEITSSLPIAVFAGAKAAEIPSGPGMPGLTASDHLFEQMISINNWGDSFVTAPLMQRDSGDTFRILSMNDSTIININGIIIDTLNSGVFWESIITSPSIITTTKPVNVAQFANSLSFDNTTGYPFEMLLFPASYSYKKTYFKTYYNSPVSNFDFSVNIITKSSSISSVFMDGTQVLASAFDTISGSDFSYASFQVTDGTHKIESDSGFVAYYYAFDDTDSYGLALTGYSDQNLTGLSQSQAEMMNLKLFPNPVDEILFFSLPFSPLKESLLNVKIWDVNGREVLSKNVSNSLTISVDVSALNSGIYFLVLSDISKKVIGKSKFCVNRR